MDRVIEDSLPVTAMIIPGSTGSVHKCATQVTAMLRDKPSETFALVSKLHKVESDLVRTVRYIGTIQINPTLRVSEIMTEAFKLARNECIAFIDGDCRIGPASFQKMMNAFNDDPSRVYCSVLKELGDVDGYVCGASLNDDGSSNPLVYEEQGSGVEPISCLQAGCVLFPKSALEKIASNGPCGSIEELSAKLADEGIEMCCNRSAAITYKGLVNLGVESVNA